MPVSCNYLQLIVNISESFNYSLVVSISLAVGFGDVCGHEARLQDVALNPHHPCNPTFSNSLLARQPPAEQNNPTPSSQCFRPYPQGPRIAP